MSTPTPVIAAHLGDHFNYDYDDDNYYYYRYHNLGLHYDRQ